MRSCRIPNSTFWNIALIAAVGLLLTGPAIWHGWSDLGHDSVSHARWLEEFAGQLRAGEWYPRWLTESNGRLGSPQFFYYSPLAYYLSAPLLSLWPAGSAAAWHSLGVGSALVLIASGIIAYFWMLHWAGVGGALWGAIAYMLVPWHTAISLYNAGSWSLFCAFLWMPLALLGIERVIEGRRGALLLTAAAYSLLVLTHMLTAMLFSPVLVAYAFFLAPRERWIGPVFRTGCAMLLGLCLVAVYLLPAVLQQDAISVYILRVQGGFYDFRKWFLGADIHSILDYKMRVLVVTVSMLAAALAGYWLSRSAHTSGPNRTRMLFWLAVSAVCLFFMTPLSGFLWGTIPSLTTLSQPPRFNALLTLAVAALGAGAAPAVSWSRSRWAVVLAAAFGVFWLAGTGWAASRAYFAWRSDPKGVERLQRSEHLKEELPEYQPRWALSTRGHDGIEAPLAKLPGRGLRLESASHNPLPGNASIVSWNARDAVLNVQTPQPAHLLVGQFYYPGWQARDLTGQQLLPLSPSVPDGFLSVEVPAGSHRILLRLAPQAPERIGLAVSALSCVLFFVLGIVSLLRRTEATSHTQALRNVVVAGRP